jgi:hypothetical protein
LSNSPTDTTQNDGQIASDIVENVVSYVIVRRGDDKGIPSSCSAVIVLNFVGDVKAAKAVHHQILASSELPTQATQVGVARNVRYPLNCLLFVTIESHCSVSGYQSSKR